MEPLKSFDIEIDVFGKTFFSISAANREEAEQIANNIDKHDEYYNQFWDCILTAADYKIVGVHESPPE
jgi:hypothetical protein